MKIPAVEFGNFHTISNSCTVPWRPERRPVRRSVPSHQGHLRNQRPVSGNTLIRWLITWLIIWLLPSAGSKTVNKSFLSSSGSSSLGAIIKILHKELRNFMFCVQLVSKIKRDLKRPKRPWGLKNGQHKSLKKELFELGNLVNDLSVLT